MPCTRCHGTGWIEADTVVPYGDTWVTWLGMESCPDCRDRGLCPRCGAEIVRQGRGYQCPACEWEDD